MNTKLFHKDVFLPKEIHKLFDEKLFRLIPSLHAMRASVTDRYGRIIMLEEIRIKASEIIELELNGETVEKIVLRTSYLPNMRYDISIAIIPRQNNTALIKTVWLNSVSDKHLTLDKSKYAKNW